MLKVISLQTGQQTLEPLSHLPSVSLRQLTPPKAMINMPMLELDATSLLIGRGILDLCLGILQFHVSQSLPFC